MVAENEKYVSLKKESEVEAQKDDKDTHQMSHKEWKKMKRKQKRQLLAKNRKSENTNIHEGSSSDEEKKIREEKEKEMQHILFLEREKLAQQLFQAKIERQKKEKDYLEEQQRKIKEEWEELQKMEEKEKDRRERDEQREKDRKNAWHNPIAPVNYNSQRPQNNCPFFMKTGACKYGDTCSRTHEYPAESNTVLLPGMFSHFRLDQTLIDEYDTDLSLEYEDTDLYNSFLEFYQDVLPEFQSIGKVIQFKVCSNCAPHLRGNVYVAFEKPEDASKAIIKFNGRWYAGKQLNCEYRTIDKWKSAICGLSFQNSCPKGNVCNFLHVFKNPNNEFRDSDYDYQYNSRKRAFHRYESRQGSYRRIFK
ncbi:hypothetical protein LOTGIDRAFT_235470 [Lottia gigantea]|uniref:Uncharacterized protein n=1 Tax=Lottia gigantea TaxID=225164 RepID=V3ZZM3_LOTGI|nr:hypothetical protein LOTGIDRAFT_235470 [Lottia gigantea]ESO86446.1 hypothetical protein LOTGIDRAFT_235470 [Lottia gigantea]